MSEKTTPQAPTPREGEVRQSITRSILSSSGLITVLAIVMAFVVCAGLIAMSGASVGEAYVAMFRGAIFNDRVDNLGMQLKPLTDTLLQATPLILAGLGLAVGFQAGLFNIGGNGQVMLGAIVAGYIGFAFQLPVGLHLLLAILGGIVGGAAWGFIPGILKAKTGANEVIVTIMLNAIAASLLAFLLTKNAFQQEGSNNPKSPSVADTATLHKLFEGPYRLHWGFFLALVATVVVWFILERSTFGFQLRAVGANPHASQTAGMSIGRITILTLVLSGSLCGLAGASEVLGTQHNLTNGIAGSVGFDAITVALLGRNKPIGTLFAGLLFGAFRAGNYAMQQAGVPVDMVLILQSIVVLLIAAPALVRAIFRLPAPGYKTKKKVVAKQEAAA